MPVLWKRVSLARTMIDIFLSRRLRVVHVAIRIYVIDWRIVNAFKSCLDVKIISYPAGESAVALSHHWTSYECLYVTFIERSIIQTEFCKGDALSNVPGHLFVRQGNVSLRGNSLQIRFHSIRLCPVGSGTTIWQG